jgi:hypothetical protein
MGSACWTWFRLSDDGVVLDQVPAQFDGSDTRPPHLKQLVAPVGQCLATVVQFVELEVAGVSDITVHFESDRARHGLYDRYVF